jgi:tetraacyldisaccharide 4'-kinase
VIRITKRALNVNPKTSAVRQSGAKYRAVVNGHRGLGPSLSRLGLRAASVPYGCVVWLRNRLYDCGGYRIYRAEVPVVSVGNLTLGGTGKTPCVEYVARYYREQGRRVAILSRGYGGCAGRNDEALVLEDNLRDVPHLQGADRVKLARQAVDELAGDVLLLDDGFQHRRLARDLELVLVDATDPWGQGYLFPRGWLREPAVELRRASVVMLTRCDQVEANERGRLREAITRLAPKAPIVESDHRPIELVGLDGAVAGLDRLKMRPVMAFSGIGNPEAFRRTLNDLGANVVAWRTFPDHHRYSEKNVEDLLAWADSQKADCLMATTQNDLVKIRQTQWAAKDLWAVRIQLHIESGEKEFHQKLAEVVDKCNR